jgi:hypothetical protein
MISFFCDRLQNLTLNIGDFRFIFFLHFFVLFSYLALTLFDIYRKFSAIAFMFAYRENLKGFNSIYRVFQYRSLVI